MAFDAPRGDATRAEVCFDDNQASAYLEGALPPGEHQRVERHAAQCDTCRELLSTLARLRAEETDLGLDAPNSGELRTELTRSGPDARVPEKTLPPGTAVGRYLVIDRLAEGGMGVVYRARDTRLERTVALKFLLADGTVAKEPVEGEARLLREAQAIAKLAHPNVVVVYDFGTFGDDVFLAMEFVPGGTLRGWLREGRHPWRQTLGCFLQAGEGLAHAHAAGLVHRDFKPENVLMGADGRPRVTDFGLARSASEDSRDTVNGAAQPPPAQLLDMRLTRTGMVMGTPGYMAPEQFRGEATSAAADQFAFCVGLYEALYGQRPFSRETIATFAVATNPVEPRPPPTDTEVPKEVFVVLRRGLDVSPERRHPSMNDLLGALRSAAEPTRGPGWKWAVAAGVMVLLALGAAALSERTRDPAPVAPIAEPGPPAPTAPTAPPAGPGEAEPREAAAPPDRVGEAPASPSPPTAPTSPRPQKKAKSNRLQRNGMINPF